MRTGFRNHGGHGSIFVGSRLLSGIATLVIIGLVGNFISQINHAHLAAPEQLTAALVITCCGLLWVLISFTAYDDTHIPYLATAIVDWVFLIPCVAIVVVLGGPLSQTDCSSLSKQSGNLTSELASAETGGNGTLSYITLIGEDQTTCYKLQATWGLMIALCILFVFSGIAAAFIFLRNRHHGYKGSCFGRKTERYGVGIRNPQ